MNATKASTETQNRFRSANIHICSSCNYHCGFCFAKNISNGSLTFEEWKPIFEDLRYNQGIEKINFAGGEPLLYRELLRCCQFCKSIGFVVSIVSNGSLITREFLERAKGCIDWIGLSVDSTDEEIEVELGRTTRNENPTHIRNVIKVSHLVHEFGIKVKLNITVVSQSYQQDFSEIIRIVNPERVKVFQVMKLKGHNEDVFDKYAVTGEQFAQFVRRHEKIELSNNQHPVFEKTDDIVDSYLMLDPLGRVMRNSYNVFTLETYKELTDNGIDRSLDVNKYIRRGGIYAWNSSNGSAPAYDSSLPLSSRIGVFGITRSGKDLSIDRAIEEIRSKTRIGFVHYPYMATIHRMSEDILFKDFSETTQNEKGLLMVRYRDMISDRTRHPFVMTDEHYSYPTTYGGKVLHNEYTDAKFPFVLEDDKDSEQSYEVMFSDEYIDMYDLVYYLDTDSSEILRRIRSSNPPKNNPFITLEDIDNWKRFEKESLAKLCSARSIPFVTVPDGKILSDNIVRWMMNANKTL